ncbi:hypothetical protein C8Q70DRAFT_267842 [Cubamyces menziesii]|uniref:Fungal-type protein kinase domain-containing protein n=1 Tax=Trametes cubensis TaxID=1111947 RepID=A0AAD7TTL6_9APHY|nr:hypothetical protein C8Q70DRAFT_267842 [Cubamyces menziesii]KAJ8481079.1 hypothetical protein ONZ51_g6234 [Trametes cubensis]
MSPGKLPHSTPFGPALGKKAGGNYDEVLEIARSYVPETVDFGFGLLSASSVNELLMAVYDALEVHRTLARKHGVVHRDLSIFNIMMFPTLECHTDRRNYLQDFPRPIDESLIRKARTQENRGARCLIIDYDNSAKLKAGKASAIHQTTLQCRIGTPSYIARAVCAGAVNSDEAAMFWEEQMPLLEGNARDIYIKVYGEERYNKYNDIPADTIHGGVPPSHIRPSELRAKAKTMPFYHRWEYDAESISWTMYSALLRVTPAGFTEQPKDISAVDLTDIWDILQKHVIPDRPRKVDTRLALLLNGGEIVLTALPPCMAPVGELLLRTIKHVLPSYPLMAEPPPHDDHLHEAMKRLILQYLVDNRDTPIPLIPHQLRPVYFPEARAVKQRF